MRWLLTGLFFFVLAQVLAQGNTRQCRKFSGSATITHDQVIVPSTIQITGLDELHYTVTSLGKNAYFVQSDTLITDSLELCFQTLPSEFSRTYSGDSTRFYDSTAFFTNSGSKRKSGNYVEKRQELFDMGDLNRSGQITRGISTGNTQNLTVNSSLNLNLEGKLSDDLNIKAVITDQDIPYQPEGNTQQLQDFDNVYVQLYNEKFSVIGGDVVLQNGATHFLKYRKNVLGGRIDYSTNASQTSVGASSAKGQFASVVIEVEEGVYGPYKVPPPDNQSYVIIIANSEKIYIDGKQLVRGFDNDYTIDYNQAEVEFTSNVVLTAYSRIRVDYEYAVQNYARSIVTASHNQQLGKLQLGINYYEEKDNRNNSLAQDLTDADKQLLSSVGDSLSLAIVPGETQVVYDENKIQYIKKDTLVNGTSENIFVYATQPATEVYSVQFTNVGSGKGSYDVERYLSNGRVYGWVGNGNGSYLPYVQLHAPNKKQMITIAGNAGIGKRTSLYFESGFSQQDKNLFSDLDGKDDKGIAGLVGIKTNKLPLANSDYTFSTKLESEFLSKDFTIIDRFRRVEFDRDWGLSNTSVNSLGAEDLNITGGLSLEKNNSNRIIYEGHYRKKYATVEGFQHQIDVSKTLKIVQISASAFSMDGNLPGMRSTWRKFNGEGYLIGKIQPGYRYRLEHNVATASASDSVSSSQNYFEEHQFFVRSDFRSTTNFEVTYAKRYDKLPRSGELKDATAGETLTAKLSTLIHQNHSIKLVLNYRNLNDKFVSSDIQSVTGRIDWSGEIIPNVLRNELNYSIANARVPKREYVFVEVPTGEGTHTWRDDNGDGIKDLDEFYEAFNYDERRYIKLYVSTNAYEDAYNNRFNYQLNLRFPKTWLASSGIKRIIGRISNTTAWTTQYSTTEDNLAARLLPFLSEIDTSKLLSSRESFRTTLFINRNDPTFGVTVGYLTRARKMLYTNGFEGRIDEEYSSSVRWNVKRQYQFDLKGLWANRFSSSDYLQGRNYHIRETKAGPSIAWQPKPTLRLSTSYNYVLSLNLTEENTSENAVTNEIITELRAGSATKFTFNAQLKYAQIGFAGDEQTAVGYELLKGLKPGNNISWTLGWQQRLVNGLQMQLYYEGRKPEGVQIIHSIRAGVSALF
ncbi:MAG: hypothetical protein KDC79_03905 [Cyclobacteriaceae bacterium]|nr:hypothetical protein [Cyclobacteriaceae bacterium]